jgi:hypothetical protein
MHGFACRCRKGIDRHLRFWSMFTKLAEIEKLRIVRFGRFTLFDEASPVNFRDVTRIDRLRFITELDKQSICLIADYRLRKTV